MHSKDSRDQQQVSLGEKCPYLDFIWSVFSGIRKKYGPEKLQIRTLFTQWYTAVNIMSSFKHLIL